MSAQSFSVVTNLSSLYAQQNLYTSNTGLNKTIGRISSGYRVVDAGDDAAGLAISNRLGADVYALDQAYRNANDGSGIIQIADGALSKVTDLLNRAVTLAEQSASGTIGDSERTTIDVEYNQIKSEIDRIFDSVNFKGTKLFSTSAVKMEIFVGDTTLQSTITLSAEGTVQGWRACTFQDSSATQRVIGGSPSSLNHLKTFSQIRPMHQAIFGEIVAVTGARPAAPMIRLVICEIGIGSPLVMK